MTKVLILPYFKKTLKPLIKKFPSLKEDVIILLENFDKKGCIKIQENLYKTRLKTAGLNKGKSNSFRIIIYTIQNHNTIIPIRIYFKSVRKSVSKKEINKDLEMILLELQEVDL
jgi:mRNA-degrading endonuclease RelE of RelBE toxin-antitoxin system